MMQKAIDMIEPDAIMVAFDAGKHTFRHDLYADYKGGRKPTPDDLVPQFQMVREYCDAYHIKWIEMENIEADDLIGTASDAFKEDTITTILTSDHDLLQLADEDTSILLMKKGITDMDVMTKEKIKEDMGIEPIQIIDMKGLMGDSSDNYPGIPGVGEKTALKLLNQYGSVEGVLEHENEIKGALGKKIIQGHDDALLSKKLATIKRDVKLPFTFEDLDLLTAISPIDGRYRGKTEQLANYFSEYALIRYRVRVEIEYFITLCELPLPQLASFDKQLFERLRDIYRNLDEKGAQRVKDIEKITNHDVKAVEYFIKEEFDKIGGLDAYKEFIHFGLTSQDINNTSVPLSVKEALEECFYPQVEELIAQLQTYADEWKDVPMLAKTHGQPASPTRLGKEIMVYVYRLTEQLESLKACKITAKFGGATGNYNAHHVAYPEYDWRAFGNKFVSEKLGLEREQYTTQISNYDHLGSIFDAIRRINTIIIDLDRDFWMYISMDYFKQKIKAGEVGSSAMPHKVNPIDYENSEGNLGIANAILQFLAQKLPVSRLQRDLTDSTVLRNIGVPLGHSIIAIQSTLKGLRKLILHEEKLQEDLNNTWAVVAEAIQTILRREAYPHPYEALKALTRTNTHMTEETIHEFIKGLNVSDSVKAELMAITPSNYTGIF